MVKSDVMVDIVRRLLMYDPDRLGGLVQASLISVRTAALLAAEFVPPKSFGFFNASGFCSAGALFFQKPAPQV